MFAALEDLNDRQNINRAWENIKEYKKISVDHSLNLCNLKKHKPRFDEEFLRFLDQRKKVQMQWLQAPNQCNVDNLSNIRLKVSRHFRNKQKEYLKVKIDELETTSKIKNIRDLYRSISNFKKGYQPRTNIVKIKRLIWLDS